MTPGPDVVLACPTCGALVRQRSLASGNTFGATLWSDGYFDAPMLPQQPALAYCSGPPPGNESPSAADLIMPHWFWLDAAERVGTVDWFWSDGPVPEAWERAAHVDEPGPDGYAAALDAGLGSTPEREAFLRLRLWWAANDAHRGKDAAAEPDRGNLERLQALQDAVPVNGLELPLDEGEGWDVDEDDSDAGDDEGEPQGDARTERGDPVLRAAVALALEQPNRARQELVAAALPPEWHQAFAAAIDRSERRVVALS